MTTISVVLATFNGAQFLPEQLASLAAQTRLPDELIVSDDGSTDATLDILAHFAATAPFPVHVQRNSHQLGYRANFMYSARRCGGDVIFFCDQDDIWSPEKIVTMLPPFARPDTLAAFHDFIISDADGASMQSPWRMTGEHDRFRRGEFGSVWDAPPGFTLAIRRELLAFSDLWERSIHPNQNERMSHDHWFAFLARNLQGFVFQPVELALYRQHATNTVGWDRKQESPLRRGVKHVLNALAWRRTISDVARSRASILREIATRPQVDAAALAGLIAEAKALDRDADIWDEIGRIADGHTLVARLSRLIRCIRHGHYASGRSDLPGTRAIIGDLAAAILGRTMLRHVAG